MKLSIPRSDLYRFVIICLFLLFSVTGHSTTLTQYEADSIYEIGKALYNKSQYANSLKYFIRVKNFYHQASNDYQALDLQFEIGYCYYQIDSMAKARGAFREGLELASSSSDSVNVAYLHRGLGFIAEFENEYDQAMIHYKNALAMAAGNRNENYLLRSKLFVDMGDVNTKTNDVWLARKYLELSVSELKDNLGEDRDELARPYGGLGNLYKSLNQYAEAETYYQNAILLRKRHRGENSLSLVWLYNESCEMYLFSNQLDKAMDAAKKAYEISLAQRGEESTRAIYSATNIGTILLHQEKYEEALSFLTKTISLKEKYLKRDRRSLAESYLYVGQTYYHLNKTSLAKHFLRECLNKIGTLFSKHKYISQAYLYLARIEAQQGNYIQALALNELSISTNILTEKSIPLEALNSDVYYLDLPSLVESLSQRADILRYESAQESNPAVLLKESIRFSVLSIDLINKARKEYANEQDRERIALTLNKSIKNSAETVWSLYQLTGDVAEKETLLKISEENKASLLLSSLRRDWAHVSSGVPDSIDYALKSVQAQMDEIKSSIAVEPKAKQELWESLLKLRQEKQELSDYMERHYPSLDLYTSTGNQIDSKSIQTNLIAQNEAFIEYLMGKEHLFIFMITKSDFHISTVPIETNLEEQLNSFTKVTYDRDYKIYDLSNDLYEQLFYPVDEFLKVQHPSVERVMIIPDEAIGLVPFQILNASSDPDRPQFLIDKYHIFNQISAKIALQHKRSVGHQNQRNFLSITPGKIEANMDPLIGAKGENAKLTQMFDGNISINGGITKQGFKEMAQGYKIIHFASHASENIDVPTASKILIDTNSQNRNNNFLHRYDILNMKLTPDLVTLSACNTGVGKVQKGEGILSLARAFTHAGAKSVVMSLWQVSDHTTYQIMVQFYKNLKKGLAKDQALRQAKLEYLRNTDDYGAHPYYWAGFILTGNPEPINFEEGFSYKAQVATFFMAIFLFTLLFGFFKYHLKAFLPYQQKRSLPVIDS